MLPDSIEKVQFNIDVSQSGRGSGVGGDVNYVRAAGGILFRPAAHHIHIITWRNPVITKIQNRPETAVRKLFQGPVLA